MQLGVRRCQDLARPAKFVCKVYYWLSNYALPPKEGAAIPANRGITKVVAD